MGLPPPLPPQVSKQTFSHSLALTFLDMLLGTVMSTASLELEAETMHAGNYRKNTNGR